MEFTFLAYQYLLELLEDENYIVTNYHDYISYPDSSNIVILRHDIDYSIAKAYEMAMLEADEGIKSTYFVLVTSEFYNVAAKRNVDMLKRMQKMGHEIGLHFDEACYAEKNINEITALCEKERKLLENIIDEPVTTISMHRPSKIMLENNLQFKSMVNSYSNVFFKEFKYVSDSRMYWREDVEKIIRSHRYNRLHILTHAFWYDKLAGMGTREKLINFITHANEERYYSFKENFRNLDEFIMLKDVVK